SSNSKMLYAMVAGAATSGGGRGGRGGGGGAGGSTGLYKSTDGGEHWYLAVRGPDGSGTRAPDNRPLARIGGGDLPTVTVDPKNESVVYSASTVFWRTEDGGLTWSAVRGAPGGEDYQKAGVSRNSPNLLPRVSGQHGGRPANRR